MFSIEYLRSFRIGEYAIFDIAVSFLGVYLLAPFLSRIFMKFKIEIPLSSWMYLTLPLSILVHLVVGNITKMTANFINLQDHYLLKLFILALLFLGIKSIKRV